MSSRCIISHEINELWEYEPILFVNLLLLPLPRRLCFYLFVWLLKELHKNYLMDSMKLDVDAGLPRGADPGFSFHFDTGIGCFSTFPLISQNNSWILMRKIWYVKGTDIYDPNTNLHLVNWKQEGNVGSWPRYVLYWVTLVAIVLLPWWTGVWITTPYLGGCVQELWESNKHDAVEWRKVKSSVSKLYFCSVSLYRN